MPAPPARRLAAVVLAIVTSLGGSWSSAQDGIDLRGRLDASPGGTLLGNRPGPSIGRTPPSAYQRRNVLPQTRPDQLGPPSTFLDYPLPFTGSTDVESKLLGPQDGLTLEGAIVLMVRCNPDIAAGRSEVEQARSDIITAGLRANPQFFTDMQQVPYRVLAPNQVDINFAYPMDVSGKRKTRVMSAVCVLRSIEWKYQNFIRVQVDNLHTVFVDALAAQQTLDEYKSGATAPPPVKMNEDEASPTEEAESTLRDKQLALAVLLNLPNPKAIRLRGPIFDPRTYPVNTTGTTPALEGLKQIARDNRPDLNGKRWDLRRALADLDAIRASRFDDVTFLVQPYTYSPILSNRVGWALGITVPMPIYNRQQGNLAKAQQIVIQTRSQLASLQRTVEAEVEAAYNEVTDTCEDVGRFYAEMNKDVDVELPELRGIQPGVRSDLVFLNDYVKEQKKKNQERRRRNYYNAIIRHRKSLLRINTACGLSVVAPDEVPPDPPAGAPCLSARTEPARR